MAIYYTVNQMAQELEHEDESRYKPEPKVDRKVTPTKVRVGGGMITMITCTCGLTFKTKEALYEHMNQLTKDSRHTQNRKLFAIDPEEREFYEDR